MRLFLLRLVVVTALVLLYALHPMIGVAALAGGCGFVLADRRHRQQL